MKLAPASAGSSAWQWLVLFTGTFCITLFLQTRGSPHAVPLLQQAISVTPSRSHAGDAVEAAPGPALFPATAMPDESPVAPVPEPEPERYAAQIEAALIEDDSQARAVAIRELGQVPAEQALATLEQVLRTDSDPENRALAMQELLQMPPGSAAGSARTQLLQEFADDGDGRVAALSREGLGHPAVN